MLKAIFIRYVFFTLYKVRTSISSYIYTLYLQGNDDYKIKGLLPESFYWLKRCPFPPLSVCHRWKIWQLPIKNRKMYFCQIFGLIKLLTGRENGSQKGITERDFGYQNHLPDMNLALKTTYRTRIWPSNILTGHVFFCQYFLTRQLFLIWNSE